MSGRLSATHAIEILHKEHAQKSYQSLDVGLEGNELRRSSIQRGVHIALIRYSRPPVLI